MILRSLGLAFLLLCWLGIYGLCRELAARKQIHSDWRISWLFACAGWGALLAFVVELCSSRKMLNAPTLIAAWMTGSVILCGTAGWLAWRRGALGKGRLISWRERTVLDWGQNWPLDAKLMLVASAVLVLGQGVIALCTPTTNWDSLVYHLPRVMHWIQQQSVEHYPTANTCQLEFAPWPAFVITHLHLLQGNDRLDNLVQWFAMLTCVVVTSFIAQQLVADRHTETTSNQAHLAPASVQRRITALTCLLVTTLPIGLVESITTQTDYVVTCWFACLTCMAIALWNDPANIWYALGAGLALALGVFSKATMVIYAAPIGLAISIGALVRLPNNRLRLRLALVLVIAFLAINTPHLMRNHAVFGSALASKEILFVERNKTISLAGTCSNLIRNLVLESNSGIVPLTIWVNNCLLWLHTLTGKDLNDPDTTFPSGRFFTPRGFFLYDSTAGSFYHLLAICTAGMLALRNRKKNLVLLVYALTIGSGFLLFCMFLRWQQWHSRIHLAWLVLLAPWVSVVLTTKAPRWSCHTAGAVVWVFAIYCIFNNSSRPFLERGWFEQPREALYLGIQGRALYAPLTLVANDVISSKCEHIGLKLDPNDPEYSIWVMLQNRGFAGHLSHFQVDNESARTTVTATVPCAVIVTTKNVTATLTNMFPYEFDYGSVIAHKHASTRTFWSEPASRWAELATSDSLDQNLRVLPRDPQNLAFDKNTINLRLRSPRAGTLHLVGLVTDARGKPIGEKTLRITADADFEQTLPLQGEPLSAAIPSTGGGCKITLTLTDPAFTNAFGPRLEGFQWRWETAGDRSPGGP